MVLKKLFGSTATRSLAVVSILKSAKRAVDRGNYVRAGLMLGVAVLAWKWVLIGMVAQGVVGLLRKDDSSDSPDTSTSKAA
ncbi:MULTISPECIES: hypothetical protein [Natronococcus]|uniref:Polyphosphate kinase n=1 Tax=Natronococcus amylolyticus DSM 10524 TaxID=1227497 RepID=L9XAU7_9EURY|nr:hypothetical protein [Natronococcus amylolyticus]ELY58869.1 polyphosphate kinase [Natronococcus amylolyticus DSM 10524]